MPEGKKDDSAQQSVVLQMQPFLNTRAYTDYTQESTDVQVHTLPKPEPTSITRLPCPAPVCANLQPLQKPEIGST